MMSHFGHEAIFTLDYTINENQMSDCLMPREREREGEYVCERDRGERSRRDRTVSTSKVLQFRQSAGPVPQLRAGSVPFGGVGRQWFLRC